jgi:hypothetical protein
VNYELERMRKEAVVGKPGICLEELIKTMKTSVQPVSGPRFEPITFGIQSRGVNHSTTTSGEMFYCITQKRRIIIIIISQHVKINN